METASLRIKFTPIYNNSHKNGSKYCLEIVPEVSCVQNLDKISWKQETDSVEYTIPMTYKITLKKRQSLKTGKDDMVINCGVPELDKTYHSCVDLLPPSSMTTFDFGSGDVTRIISDTYILGKISAKFNEEHLFNNPVNDIQAHDFQLLSNDCPKELPLRNNMTHEEKNLIHKEYNENVTAFSKHCLVGGSNEKRLVNQYSIEKITNTEDTLAVCKVVKTQSAETTNEISTRSRYDSKRKLSLSPICSIDTNNDPFRDNAEEVSLNFVVDRIFQYETGDFSENAAYALPTRNEKILQIKTLNNDRKDSVESFYKTHKRELPEARVAKFIKKMEIEIMPLKMMLNDILQKCSTLGLSKNKYIARNLILYKSIPSCKNQVEKLCKKERQMKSNRVVYSIVFEG